MRIYGEFLEDEGLTRISLSPFEKMCYYVDAEEGSNYETQFECLNNSPWKPYNVEDVFDTCLHNPKTGEDILIYDYYTYGYTSNCMIKFFDGTGKDLSEFKGFGVYDRFRTYKEGKIVKEIYEGMIKEKYEEVD